MVVAIGIGGKSDLKPWEVFLKGVGWEEGRADNVISEYSNKIVGITEATWKLHK